MSKGNLTLLFNNFEFNYQHLNKDVFLIPYNLGKKLGYDVTIVYPSLPENQNFPLLYRGVKLERVKFRRNIKIFPFWKHINFYIYILRHALHIDVLVRFHLSTHTEFIIILYKLLNSSGRSYLKLDISEDTIDLLNSNLKKTLKRSIHNKVSKIFINKVDVISCETTKTLSKIKSSINPNLNFGHKLIIIPNGVDDEIMKFKTRDYIEKENLMITVGRIGSKQKNNEVILRALAKVSLNHWKFYFIGTIEPHFKLIIDHFFRDNPGVEENVKFLGPIYDRETLYSFYNRSKVFVLSSNWEGYPIVFCEAIKFNNYIISTDLAAAQDITQNFKYGVRFPFDDELILSEILNEITSGRLNTDVFDDFDESVLYYEKIINKIKI